MTASPEPAPDDPELSFCGAFDAALARAAARVLARPHRDLPEPLELGFLLRSEGEPHVWPRVFRIDGAEPDGADVATRFRAFLATFHDGGTRRCGVARRRDEDGTLAVSAVVVDAFADLERLPTRGRTGEWLTLSAELLVPASGAKVVVLGPRGSPRAVPTSLEGARATARFSLDAPGAFTVQVVATTDEGPRPVAEALVFADTDPPDTLDDLPAPGERAGEGEDAASALASMINAARTAEGRAALARNATLDAVAEAHARVLATLGHLAHEAGDGDPISRVQRAGLEPRSTGENVAHGASPARVHRVLWASPSHRGNLLDGRFEQMGVGAVRAPDGQIWVCELFARFD